jgi:hypothetical protein
MLTYSLQSHVKQPAPVYRQSPAVVKKGPSIARFRKSTAPDEVVPINSYKKRMCTGLCVHVRVRVRAHLCVYMSWNNSARSVNGSRKGARFNMALLDMRHAHRERCRNTAP